MRAPWLVLVLATIAAKGASCEPVLWRQHNTARAIWRGAPRVKGVLTAERAWRQRAHRQLLQNSAGIILRNCSADCQAEQRDALLGLYQAWGGQGWAHQDGWLTDSPVCGWHGVMCCLLQSSEAAGAQGIILSQLGSDECPAGTNGVVGLSLVDNNMTGDVAAVRWSAFSATLLLLELDDNNLQGDSSTWAGGGGLAVLSSLQFLSLGGNRLAGPLKPFLELPAVWALMLHSNRLAGTLPEELVTHPSLEFVDLEDNRFVGPLPSATFTSANRLRSLNLAYNGISGTFPRAGAQLPARLSHLDLGGNKLSGTLPRYLSLLLLDHLDASSNALEGPVAPLLQTAWAVLSLNLSNNSLQGSLPADVRCRHVKLLDLSHNNLTGSIPASFAKLHSVVNLLLNGNRGLNGQLPNELPNITQLSYFDIRGTSMQAAVAGSAGLPQLIILSNTTFITSSDPNNPTCPIPLLRGSVPVGIAPYYWQYDGCKCKPGFTPNYRRGPPSSYANGSGSSGDGPIVDFSCVEEGHLPLRPPGHGAAMPAWGLALSVLGGLLVMVLGLLLAYRLVPSVVRYRTLLAKRMPPGFSRRVGGCVVTLVLTDVEGSTELWEWDTDLMAAAIDLHDHTLRSQMSKWYGYEVQTEGDAFLMAFHEPADAVGWCITTQLALLNADWDRELFRHHKACIETHESLQPSSQTHSERISVGGSGGPGGGGAGGAGGGGGSGAAATASVTETGNVPLPPRQTLPPGIIIGSGPPLAGGGLYGGASGLSSARGGLTPHRVSAGGNEETSAAAAMAGGVTGAGGGGAVGAGAGGSCGPGTGGGGGGGPSQDNSRQLKFVSETRHPESALGAGTASAAEFADWTRYTRLGVLYRGLRVRMGVATGVTDAITSHAITQRMEYSGEVYRRVQAVADLPHGGQVLLDATTFNAIHNNLNDLGIRAIQILTRDKRSSTNGAGGAGGGGGGGARSALRLGNDRRRQPRSARNRQSLELAFGPEAAEQPGELGSSMHGVGGDEDSGAAGAAAAVTAAAAAGGSGNALSVATSGRTLSVGGSWMRGAGGAGNTAVVGVGIGTPPGSLLSAVVGSGLGFMAAISRGSSPLPRHSIGPDTPQPSGRSARMASVLSSRVGKNPVLNHTNHANTNSKSPHIASTTAPPAAVPPAGPGSGGGTSSSGGGGGGGRALLIYQGSGSAGQLPQPPSGLVTVVSSRPRPASTTGMYGGSVGTHLERVSQESSCKDAVEAVDLENPDRASGPQLLDESMPSGAAGRARMSAAGRRQSGGGIGVATGGGVGAAACGPAHGTGGGGVVAGGGGVMGEGPVSTSDLESLQYGGSPRDVRVGHLREVPAGPVAQATPATRATAALNTLAREAIHRRSSIAPAISVVNMGVFELNAGGSLEYVNITQVLVPGLEERARLGKPLDCARQLTPGYFNAPATAVAPLGSALRSGARQRSAFPLVTLVFCSMERFTEMLAVNRDLSLDIMSAYNDCVRRSLLACNGYECQEQEGNYMIAFARPADALEWCLMLQELMMEVGWSPSMLRLPAMQEELHPLTGTVLFRGPRIKAGVYQGVPTRVSPHSTTGRADYFGPLVNRAARYCHAAAQGGQVIVSRSLVEDILRELLHGELLPAEALPTEDLPVRQIATIDNTGVVPSRWCMPQDAAGGDGGGGGTGGGGVGMASATGNTSIGGGEGRRASGKAAAAAMAGRTRLADISSVGDTDATESRMGSIMVMPEFPGSTYGIGGGASGGGGGAVSRLRRVRYQSPSSSPPPPRISYGGVSAGTATGESDRGGTEGVIVGPASAGGVASTAFRHALTFGEQNGTLPAVTTEEAASDPSIGSIISMTSGSASAAAAAAAAATAAATAAASVALEARDSRGSDPAAASGGFPTVEVSLSELVKYDICPANVPRRMRPAVEQALAESRRRAASARRDHLQTQSRMAASYSPPLLPSRPPSRRTMTLLPPPPLPTAATPAGTASALAAPAGPIAYSSSIMCGGGGGGEKSARVTGGGMVVTNANSTLLQSQLLPSGPTPEPPPHNLSATLPTQQHIQPHPHSQHQQQRLAMRGSEPAYLELTPQVRQQLQQQLQLLQQEPLQQQQQGPRGCSARSAISERGPRAGALAQPWPLPAAAVATGEEATALPLAAAAPPLPQTQGAPRPGTAQRASLDLHQQGQNQPGQNQQQTLAQALQARASNTPSQVGSSRAHSSPNANANQILNYNLNPNKASLLRTPHSHYHYQASSVQQQQQVQQQWQQQPQPQPQPQQQPQQLFRGSAVRATNNCATGNVAASRRSLGRRVPGMMQPQLPQLQGAAAAAAAVSVAAPSPSAVFDLQQQQQHQLMAAQWRGEGATAAAAAAAAAAVGGVSGGGSGPPLGAMQMHSAALQSAESMYSMEHSAAFNALWEMATDEGGVPSGSRMEGEPQSAAVTTGMIGFEQEGLLGLGSGGLVSAPPGGYIAGENGGGDGGGRVADRARLPAALRGGPSTRARHRCSFMILDSTPGCLPTLSELCIRRRVGPYKWLWAHELVVEDLGQYRFKGVAGNHSIVSVSTAGTSERKLGSRVKKSKGERVEAGRGLLYRIVLQPVEPPQPTPDDRLLQAAYASESGAPMAAPPAAVLAPAGLQRLPLMPIASAPALQRMAYSAYAASPSERGSQPSPFLHTREPEPEPASLGNGRGSALAAAAALAAPLAGALAPAPMARSHPGAPALAAGLTAAE